MCRDTVLTHICAMSNIYDNFCSITSHPPSSAILVSIALFPFTWSVTGEKRHSGGVGLSPNGVIWLINRSGEKTNIQQDRTKLSCTHFKSIDLIPDIIIKLLMNFRNHLTEDMVLSVISIFKWNLLNPRVQMWQKQHQHRAGLCSRRKKKLKFPTSSTFDAGYPTEYHNYHIARHCISAIRERMRKKIIGAVESSCVHT